MPHSKELLDLIENTLLADYPATSYRYTREKVLAGTRMFPDIQISNQQNHVVCAVEVGYTRPEKLSRYRQECGIPDVRWYDKSGKLHTVHDLKQSIELKTTVLQPPIWDCSVYGFSTTAVHECSHSKMAPTSELEHFLLTDHVSRILVPSYCVECNATWLEDSLLEVHELVSSPQSWELCAEFICEFNYKYDDLDFSYNNALVIDAIRDQSRRKNHGAAAIFGEANS
ncbi:MAG TPA: hypothetical protein V6C76_11545 [Drouetiella sp.]